MARSIVCGSTMRSTFAIRTNSPDTMISAYRGDICATTGSLYTDDGPEPNSTNTAGCGKKSETGTKFHPSEMHGITMQELSLSCICCGIIGRAKNPHLGLFGIFFKSYQDCC